MAYKVSGVDGLAGILIARRACGMEGVARSEQAVFYKKCGAFLQDFSFGVTKMARNGVDMVTVQKSVPASYVLSNCQINDERTDPQTVMALDCLAQCATRDHVELTCCALLAMFNGRVFVAKLRKDMMKAAVEKGGRLLREELLAIADRLLQACRLADLFTTSFDRRAHHSASADLVASRRKKVAQFHLKKKEGALKGCPGRKAVTKKCMAMAFAQRLCVLLGRNALSLLELHYKQKSHLFGAPPWVGERGALFGPGALMGANLLRGEWKARHASTQSFVDVMSNYDDAPLHTKRFKKLIRAERVP